MRISSRKKKPSRTPRERPEGSEAQVFFSGEQADFEGCSPRGVDGVSNCFEGASVFWEEIVGSDEIKIYISPLPGSGKSARERTVDVGVCSANERVYIHIYIYSFF